MKGVRIDDDEAVVKPEELARLKAFYRFQQEILFSLYVWKIDENVQEKLPPVSEWIRDCTKQLEAFINAGS